MKKRLCHKDRDAELARFHSAWRKTLPLIRITVLRRLYLLAFAFNRALRGAFRYREALDYFQPMVILSGKASISTSPRPRFSSIELAGFSTFTILCFLKNVNSKVF